jgi:hypothetical protein
MGTERTLSSAELVRIGLDTVIRLFRSDFPDVGKADSCRCCLTDERRSERERQGPAVNGPTACLSEVRSVHLPAIRPPASPVISPRQKPEKRADPGPSLRALRSSRVREAVT